MGELEDKLIVGAKIKLGEKFCETSRTSSFQAGEVIELVEGYFDEDNGLYCTTVTAPSIWNDRLREYDSIYHLFGNDLSCFEDCEVIES